MIPFIEIPAWLFWLMLGGFVSWAAWFLVNAYFELQARARDPYWHLTPDERDRVMRGVKPLPETWCGNCGSTLNHPEEARDVCPTYEAMLADEPPRVRVVVPRRIFTDDEALSAARDADKQRRAAR